MIRRKGRWVKYLLVPSAFFFLWYFQVDPMILDDQKDHEKTPSDKLDVFSKGETNMEALKNYKEMTQIKGEIVRRLKETENGAVPAVKQVKPAIAGAKSGASGNNTVAPPALGGGAAGNDSQNGGVAADSLQGSRQNGLPSNSPSDTTEPAKEISSEIPEINRKIRRTNMEQEILNRDKFGSDFKYVIAVQVHNRVQYLRQLLESLREARGIDQTLLIFSHDVYQDDINSMVRSINFTRVLQIFYPFSIQTHPYTFPGESSKDCPRNAKPEEVKKLNCINKDWPDLYGHFREAKFTQTKHHWWWKANRIFNHLNSTSSFKGLVIFMEEDHYVTSDFLHVLNLMHKHNNKLSNPANILSLGTYLKKLNYKENSKQVEMTQWVSSLHNMGMALTKSTWNKIIQCQNHFCQYDDYNWDWSLLYVSLNCLKDKLQVMVSKGPRIFHIGECGVHHKKKDCNSSAVVNKVKFIVDSAKKYFFPESLRVSTRMPRRKLKLKKSNGGWGDLRDHQLCLNFSTLPD
eukprot:TRINITY_DN12067_c0_g1_i4.p1 TRINITY_DN12067_c0_g1~~TRINITY_DN12067_c0_g1_i4.p1  ORF type:complete len:517 (-),score=99.95 TRINITY_DN12067_c0_g1_i4:174-1724(-)